MTDSCLNELSTYQFPNISKDQLLEDPYKIYTQMYIQLSDDFDFFHGYCKPNPIRRAQIYRALQFSTDPKHLNDQKLHSLSFNDNLQNEYIVFNTPDGLVIKKKKNCHLDKYEILLNESDQLVFIPPKYDQLSEYEFSYYRRLLSNFVHSEKIPGTILFTVEQDCKFLFVALTSPIRTKLSKKWTQYIQGGVIRKYKFPSHYLLAVLNNFPWLVRKKFKILPDKDICIWIRSPSLDDFEFQLNKIYAQSYHSEFNMMDWYHIDLLDVIINNELAVIGIIRLLVDNWIVIPLIKTSRLYILNKTDSDCSLEIIQKRLKEIENFDLEGFEPFTVRRYDEMSVLEKLGLIKTPQNHWYSILSLYQSSWTHTNKNFRDPLTNLKFSKGFKSELIQICKNIHPIFNRGFPPKLFEPELITVETESEFPKILFYVKLDSKNSSDLNPEQILFWKIPDFRSYQPEFAKLTLDAIQLIVSKWSDKSLFQARTFYKDIYLIFNPQALYVWEKTLSRTKKWSTDPKILADKLLKQLHILAKI